MNDSHHNVTIPSLSSSLVTVHASTDQTSSTQNEQQQQQQNRVIESEDTSISNSEISHHCTKSVAAAAAAAAAVGTSSTIDNDDIEQQQQPKNNIDQTIEDEPSHVTVGNRFTSLFKDGRAIAVLLVMGGGIAVAFQSAANGAMRVAAGRSFSSVANFVVGLFMEILAFLFDIYIVKAPKPTVKRLKEAPWYSWIGGILGTYYVIINIFTVTQMGAGVVLSVFVCSQVITACIMDHFGLAGIPKRKFTIWRILGSLGLIGCVAVITIF